MEEPLKSIKSRLLTIEENPQLLPDLLKDMSELEYVEEISDAFSIDEILIQLFKIGIEEEDEESLKEILDIIEKKHNDWDIDDYDLYPKLFDLAIKYLPDFIYEIAEKVETNIDQEQYITLYDDHTISFDSDYVKFIPLITDLLDPECSPLILNLEPLFDAVEYYYNIDGLCFNEEFIEFLLDDKIVYKFEHYNQYFCESSVKELFLFGLEYFFENKDDIKFDTLLGFILNKVVFD